ncbi:MAG: hypothetical protein R8K22_07770 [Mariprofundaceae bacterium]
MSQALIREISVRLGLKSDGQRKTAEMLFAFERLYWLFALLAALGVSLLSAIIGNYWLDLGDLPASLGQLAVLGAAALFAVQFPGSVYRSMLVGGQAQVPLNVIMSTTAILRHLGAVLILMVWPSLLAYLIWHCAIGLIETLLRRFFAWRCLTVKRQDVRWKPSVLKSTWLLVVSMVRCSGSKAIKRASESIQD